MRKPLNIQALIVVFFVTLSSQIHAQSPGDTVGWTNLEYQCTGSTGNRVALDSAGGVHFAWTRGSGSPIERGVSYNYLSPSGQWMGEITMGVQSAYPQVSLLADNRSVIPYLRTPAIAESLECAVEISPGTGDFAVYRFPGDVGDSRIFYPSSTVDRQGRIHVVATGSDFQDLMIIGYSRSTNQGVTWTPQQLVAQVTTISAVITSSPVSNKVAIVYCFPFDTSVTWLNDIYYIESYDGLTWDWQNGPVNVTGYDYDNDSISVFTDCDAVYDYNDNLHMVWHTVVNTFNGVGNRITIYHADQISESIVEVTHADFNWFASCGPGAWNVALGKLSLSVHPTNLLAATYVKFDTADCSATGLANGEIYLQTSPNGVSWFDPVNITNSPSPGCPAGNCNSDHWPSAAERIGDDWMLHLFYVNDKDAGSYIYGEGAVTDNPMLYYPIFIIPYGIDESSPIPTDFTLHQNYPNPFNAETRISFELRQPGNVRLDIFDITGARVATLLNEHRIVGRYNVTWDADHVSSGIYFYRLETGGEAQTKRMTLLK